MQRKRWFGLGTLLAVGVAGTAVAGGPVRLSARPGVYDPERLGNVDAKWYAHEGLPDVGKSDHALVLLKLGETAEFSAAGAYIDGAEGLTVEGSNPSDFGFDIRADSHIGAGAPRFNLVTQYGLHIIGGAGHGSVVNEFEDSNDRTWYRVRFDAQNPAQARPPVPAGAKVLSLTLLADEGVDTDVENAGQYILDNIMFNPAESLPILIGRPGQNQAGENY